MDNFKICTKCLKPFPLENFNLKGGGRRNSHCKSCCRDWKRAHKDLINEENRAYRIKNPDRVKALWKAQYWKDISLSRSRARDRRKKNYWKNPERGRQACRDYHHRNKDAMIARMRAWREKNRDLMNEIARTYRKSNLPKIRLLNAKRRARLSGATGNISLKEWEALKSFYANCCLSCGNHESHEPMTMDHVIPISKGGSHTISNIQPLCRSCNSYKGLATIDFRPESCRFQKL